MSRYMNESRLGSYITTRHVSLTCVKNQSCLRTSYKWVVSHYINVSTLIIRMSRVAIYKWVTFRQLHHNPTRFSVVRHKWAMSRYIIAACFIIWMSRVSIHKWVTSRASQYMNESRLGSYTARLNMFHWRASWMSHVSLHERVTSYYINESRRNI